MTPPTTTRAKRTASKFVLLFFPLCLGSPSAAASRAFLASGALCLRLPRCVAFWWNFPLARVVFAWPDVASPSVQLGLPVRWAGVTAPGLFLGSLCDHAETDARKFNSAQSRRRRMLSAGALSAGSTNPRSQGRRRDATFMSGPKVISCAAKGPCCCLSAPHSVDGGRCDAPSHISRRKPLGARRTCG